MLLLFSCISVLEKSPCHEHHWDFSKVATIELYDNAHYIEVHFQQKKIAGTFKKFPLCSGSMPDKHAPSVYEVFIIQGCPLWQVSLFNEN